jgi:nitrile hydratase accessory protein
MSSHSDVIRHLPDLPCDGSGPVFREPWEAQAFALVVDAHQKGLFTWSEWAQALSQEIKAAQAQGDPDTGETYYQHWLCALEQLVIAKGAISRSGLTDLQNAWERAAKATPHGQPIMLENDPAYSA